MLFDIDRVMDELNMCIEQAFMSVPLLEAVPLLQFFYGIGKLKKNAGARSLRSMVSDV